MKEEWGYYKCVRGYLSKNAVNASAFPKLYIVFSLKSVILL